MATLVVAASGVLSAMATGLAFASARGSLIAAGVPTEGLAAVFLRVVALEAAVIAILAGVFYEVTRRRVRPLLDLTRAAQRIACGELMVSLPDTDSRDEVGMLTTAFREMTEHLRYSREQLEASHERLRVQNDELQRTNEVLEQLSITDSLTKLHNHRFFHEHLAREMKRAARTGEPLSLILIDVDEFKGLNDSLGHAEGDATLLRVAAALTAAVRETDLVARHGGDEFAVVAPGTDAVGALQIAEKLRMGVSAHRFRAADGEIHTPTVSVGVAQFRDDAAHFFQRADRALYRAKSAGRNCVMADGLD